MRFSIARRGRRKGARGEGRVCRIPIGVERILVSIGPVEARERAARMRDLLLRGALRLAAPPPDPSGSRTERETDAADMDGGQRDHPPGTGPGGGSFGRWS